jgi:hypothetical protein
MVGLRNRPTPKMMRYCPKYKHKIEETIDCIHCRWNLPITLDLKINCTYPVQLYWNENFKGIKND